METIEQLADWFQKNKIECRMYCWSTSNYKWAVYCEKSDDGIKLEIHTIGNTLFEALYDAHEKFHLTSLRGASNLLAPVIEHKTLPSDTPSYEATARPSVDDDIPF